MDKYAVFLLVTVFVISSCEEIIHLQRPFCNTETTLPMEDEIHVKAPAMSAVGWRDCQIVIRADNITNKLQVDFNGNFNFRTFNQLIVYNGASNSKLVHITEQNQKPKFSLPTSTHLIRIHFISEYYYSSEVPQFVLRITQLDPHDANVLRNRNQMALTAEGRSGANTWCVTMVVVDMLLVLYHLLL